MQDVYHGWTMQRMLLVCREKTSERHCVRSCQGVLRIDCHIRTYGCGEIHTGSTKAGKGDSWKSSRNPVSDVRPREARASFAHGAARFDSRRTEDLAGQELLILLIAMQRPSMLDATSIVYALRTGATKKSRNDFANAIVLGFKIGAVLFLILLAIDLITR